MAPLHEMNPTTRFADRARDYARHRPSYPPGAIDAILAGLGGPTRLVAADVGAGTGISARLIAERGAEVIALEPNPAMRDAAAPHPRVRWREAAAESTGLDPASADLVLCAQAFHWFRPAEALREFHRVLKPGGRLALMWNRRSTTDPLTSGYRDALLAAGVESLMERMPFDPAVLPASGWFPAPRLLEFPHDQPLDLDGLVGRAMSASYVPRIGPGADVLVERLRALHARHRDGAGRVFLRHSTQVYLAERT